MASPSRAATVPGTLFLGDLSIFCTHNELLELLSPFGPIEYLDIKIDPMTGRCLNYGFVRYIDPQHADAAITALQGIILHGREMKIGRPKGHEGYQPIKRSANGITHQLHCTFYSQQIYELITERTLRDSLERFGNVVDICVKKLVVDDITNQQSGYAFVHFPDTPEGIQSAINATSMNRVTIGKVFYQVTASHGFMKFLHEKGKTLQDTTQGFVPYNYNLGGADASAGLAAEGAVEGTDMSMYGQDHVQDGVDEVSMYNPDVPLYSQEPSSTEEVTSVLTPSAAEPPHPTASVGLNPHAREFVSTSFPSSTAPIAASTATSTVAASPNTRTETTGSSTAGGAADATSPTSSSEINRNTKLSPSAYAQQRTATIENAKMKISPTAAGGGGGVGSSPAAGGGATGGGYNQPLQYQHQSGRKPLSPPGKLQIVIEEPVTVPTLTRNGFDPFAPCAPPEAVAQQPHQQSAMYHPHHPPPPHLPPHVPLPLSTSASFSLPHHHEPPHHHQHQHQHHQQHAQYQQYQQYQQQGLPLPLAPTMSSDMFSSTSVESFALSGLSSVSGVLQSTAGLSSVSGSTAVHSSVSTDWESSRSSGSMYGASASGAEREWESRCGSVYVGTTDREWEHSRGGNSSIYAGGLERQQQQQDDLARSVSFGVAATSSADFHIASNHLELYPGTPQSAPDRLPPPVSASVAEKDYGGFDAFGFPIEPFATMDDARRRDPLSLSDLGEHLPPPPPPPAQFSSSMYGAATLAPRGPSLGPPLGTPLGPPLGPSLGVASAASVELDFDESYHESYRSFDAVDDLRFPPQQSLHPLQLQQPPLQPFHESPYHEFAGGSSGVGAGYARSGQQPWGKKQSRLTKRELRIQQMQHQLQQRPHPPLRSGHQPVHVPVLNDYHDLSNSYGGAAGAGVGAGGREGRRDRNSGGSGEDDGVHGGGHPFARFAPAGGGGGGGGGPPGPQQQQREPQQVPPRYRNHPLVYPYEGKIPKHHHSHQQQQQRQHQSQQHDQPLSHHLHHPPPPHHHHQQPPHQQHQLPPPHHQHLSPPHHLPPPHQQHQKQHGLLPAERPNLRNGFDPFGEYVTDQLQLQATRPMFPSTTTVTDQLQLQATRPMFPSTTTVTDQLQLQATRPMFPSTTTVTAVTADNTEKILSPSNNSAAFSSTGGDQRYQYRSLSSL